MVEIVASEVVKGTPLSILILGVLLIARAEVQICDLVGYQRLKFDVAANFINAHKQSRYTNEGVSVLVLHWRVS